MGQKQLTVLGNVIKMKYLKLLIFLPILLQNCKSDTNNFSYDQEISSNVGLSSINFQSRIENIYIYKTSGGISEYLSDEERLLLIPINVIDQTTIKNLIEGIRSCLKPIVVEAPDKFQKNIYHIIIYETGKLLPGYIRFVRDSKNRNVGHIETWHGSGSYYRTTSLSVILDEINKKHSQ